MRASCTWLSLQGRRLGRLGVLEHLVFSADGTARVGSRAVLEEMPEGKRKHADAYHADRNPEQSHHELNEHHGGSAGQPPERYRSYDHRPRQDAERVSQIHPPGVTFTDPPGGTERDVDAPQRYSRQRKR